MHFKFITKHYLDTTLFRKSHGQNVAAIPIFRIFLHVVFDGPITAFSPPAMYLHTFSGASIE